MAVVTRPWEVAWLSGPGGPSNSSGARFYTWETMLRVVEALEETPERSRFEDSLLRSFRAELERTRDAVDQWARMPDGYA